MIITPAIIKASIEAPLFSSFLPPETQIISTENWYQVITPGVKEPSLNEVVISRVPGNEVDQKIEDVFAMYTEHGLPFKWIISPLLSTIGLEEKIAPQAEKKWNFRGMAASTGLFLSESPEVRTEIVTEKNFQTFLETYVEGWNVEDRQKHKNLLHRSLTQSRDSIYFLSIVGNEPAGVAGLVVKPTCGYLNSAVVLPAFRGKNVYKSLISSRLQFLKDHGLLFAVTQARDTSSAPILERLGFQTTFQGTIYQFAT